MRDVPAPWLFWNTFHQSIKVAATLMGYHCYFLVKNLQLFHKNIEFAACRGGTATILFYSAYFDNSFLSNVQPPLYYGLITGKRRACIGNLYRKLVSAIFWQIFIFDQMIALQKLRKMPFISSKKLFSFSRYLNFCISIFPSFSPCQALL